MAAKPPIFASGKKNHSVSCFAKTELKAMNGVFHGKEAVLTGGNTVCLSAFSKSSPKRP